ncbi:MAG: hypothetical protein AB1500_01065 [Bacillota bacterium]
MDGKPNWTGWHTFGLLAIIAAIMLIGLLASSGDKLCAWLGIIALMAVFTTVAGHGVTGLWRGLLIDERNKISLSRLQMTLWTIVVLSGFFTAALSNLRNGQTAPLSIAVPSELWLLMGISTTSLVGSPLIKSGKRAKEPRQAERDCTFDLIAKQGGDINKVTNKGQIVVNTTPEEARWSDLFRGEETGNAAQLDLAKIQMFYFTLILVLAYATALGAALAGSAAKIAGFPALDPGMVALMGISHAGYLTNKAVPHSETD